MPSHCCSSSDFLQCHCTILLSSFILPFSGTSWWCCSHPYISQILQVQIVSFSVLSFCRTDQEFMQWPRIFVFWRCLPRISLTVSVTAVLKVVIIGSMSVSSLFMMVRETWVFCFNVLILFRRRWKVIISKSWSLPVSVPVKLRVLALFTPDRKRFLTRM